MFNVRLSKCGGILPSLRIIGLAQRSGLGLQLGCHPGETAILSAAGRHVASRVDGLSYVEGSYDRHILGTNLTREDITFGYGGWAEPLAGPGLGIEVDPSALEAMTTEQRRDRLMTETGARRPHVRGLRRLSRSTWPSGPPRAPLKGRVVVLARRPEPLGLVSLARPDAGRGGVRGLVSPTAAARARTCAIAATPRPAAGWSSDIAEWLKSLRDEEPSVPITLAGISWGGKLVVIAAAQASRARRRHRPDLPGLLPRVGVSLAEKFQIAWALFTNRRKMFPIPLSDPALFTANPEAQAFIAADPHGLRQGTAGLMAASFFIDRMVQRAPRQCQSARPADARRPGPDRRQPPGRSLTFRRWRRPTGRSSSIPRAITPWSSSPTPPATLAT